MSRAELLATMARKGIRFGSRRRQSWGPSKVKNGRPVDATDAPRPAGRAALGEGSADRPEGGSRTHPPDAAGAGGGRRRLNRSADRSMYPQASVVSGQVSVLALIAL